VSLIYTFQTQTSLVDFTEFVSAVSSTVCITFANMLVVQIKAKLLDKMLKYLDLYMLVYSKEIMASKRK